jgi:hypothetical protein
MNPELIRACHVELTKLVADGLQRLADGSTVGRLVFVP